MKKQSKYILISLGALALVTTIGGGVFMTTGIGNKFHTYIKEKKEEKRLTTKEGQLAYLKEHQQEIKDFVKSQSPQIESVQIYWDETQWDEAGLFIPEKYISVYGGLNGLEDSDWSVDIWLDKDGKVDLKTMSTGNQVRIGGDPI